MKKILLYSIAIIVAVLFVRFFIVPPIDIKKMTDSDSNKTPVAEEASNDDFTIRTNAIAEDKNILVQYTCDGNNSSPEIVISNPPSGTVSYAFIVDDPDAPAGTYTHWIVFNIDANITKIDENDVPEGAVVGKNSNNTNEYFGPCPPDGSHRYFFTVYALDTTLGFDGSITAKELKDALKGHILEQSAIIGTYSREM